MLGKQSDQRGLWEADSLYIDHGDCSQTDTGGWESWDDG